MPLASVVMSVKNRAQLFRNSVVLYRKQTVPFELVVVDDGSTDNLKGVIDENGDMNIKYIRLEHSGLRSPNIGLLTGMEQCSGDVIILTCGAEVLVPDDAVETVIEGAYEMKRRVGISCFCLSQAMQEALGTVNWKEDVHEIQKIPGFWTEATPWGSVNTSYQMNGAMTLSFSGATREHWDWIGRIRRTESIGMNDRDLLDRERFLGIAGKTILGAHVYHQYHKRSGKEWSELSTKAITYTSEEQARLRC